MRSYLNRTVSPEAIVNHNMLTFSGENDTVEYTYRLVPVSEMPEKYAKLFFDKPGGGAIPISLKQHEHLHRKGIGAYEIRVLCQNHKIIGVEYYAEYTPCSGHLVGGKAPAWLVPDCPPVDIVEQEELPAYVRKRMGELLKAITS